MIVKKSGDYSRVPNILDIKLLKKFINIYIHIFVLQIEWLDNN